MTPKEILIASRAKLTPETWCPFALAIDADDNKVSPQSRYACRWCAVGALLSVAGWLRGTDILDDAARELYDIDSITAVNDGLGLEAVLRCYDLAIEREGDL